MTARGSSVRKTRKHPRPPKQPRPPRFQRVPPLIIVTLQTFNSWIILSGGQKGVTGSENIHLCKATEILLYLGAGTILTITTRVSSQEKLSGKYLTWETSSTVWFLHSFVLCTMPFSYSSSTILSLIQWLSSLLLLCNRNSYRQRNVFLYPPQVASMCDGVENTVVGNGECGTNGNTKVFKAGESSRPVWSSWWHPLQV